MLLLNILPFLKSKLDARRPHVVNTSVLQLATPGALLCHRLFVSTSGQNHWLYPVDFCSNNGLNVCPYNDVFAHYAAIAAHFASLSRTEIYIIFRESV